jgi:hypothetical protein
VISVIKALSIGATGALATIANAEGCTIEPLAFDTSSTRKPLLIDVNYSCRSHCLAQLATGQGSLPHRRCYPFPGGEGTELPTSSSTPSSLVVTSPDVDVDAPPDRPPEPELSPPVDPSTPTLNSRPEHAAANRDRRQHASDRPHAHDPIRGRFAATRGWRDRSVQSRCSVTSRSRSVAARASAA